ncbi:hypothetical protein J7K28_06520 [Candidatus Aerophobetes bacterium]|nr:hypothetical protein [Candidatus Aerophobetes bacterium]
MGENDSEDISKMKISYGKGTYIRFEGREGTTYRGEIVLDDVKIYIDGKPDSSISLDLIREMKKTKEGIEMEIIPSYSFAYKVLISGEGVKRLLSDLLIFKRFKKVWINKWKAIDFGKRRL